MNAFFVLQIVFVALSFARATERHYFIGAVDIDWDYAPSGRNMVSLTNRATIEKIDRQPNRIGSRYRKVVYRGFTDASFTTQLPVPPWAGILGPIIRCEVGEVVVVHFRNMASMGNFSLHTHGFLYNKGNEGALYNDNTSGIDKADDAVPPGGSWTYKWFAGGPNVPTRDDENCVPWGYYSHTQRTRDIDTGLVGIGLICKPGIISPEGIRMDVDRELLLYADIADENENIYFSQNIRRCTNEFVCERLKHIREARFMESNRMYHINGYVYGNLPDFPVVVGERVTWYFMSLNQGIHTIHFNGQTMVVARKRTDTVALLPSSFQSGTMVPRSPGRWMISCRNQFQATAGMQAFLDVQPNPFLPRPFPFVTNSRVYFLAIVEIIWNYQPSNRPAQPWQSNTGSKIIGTEYKKAVFREYTDASFSVLKPRAAHQVHYGLSGPVIKAEVGDRVHVVVYNKASRGYSFQANGVTVDKVNEGAFYLQHPTDFRPAGRVVHPGSVREYVFDVTHLDSPTDFDPNCIPYTYHSAVNVQRDVYSGLYGALIVCKRGTLGPNGIEVGVHNEFFLNWMVFDENLSWYIDDNIRLAIRNTSAVSKTDPKFKRSNRFQAINGRTFGTLNGLSMCGHRPVTWYMYGLGGTFDHLKVDINGDDLLSGTVDVFPGIGNTIRMRSDQLGRHNVRTIHKGHEIKGMYASYDVRNCRGRPSPRLLPGTSLQRRPLPGTSLQRRPLPGTSLQRRPPLPGTFPQRRPLPSGTFRQRGLVRRYYIGVVETDWDYAPRGTSNGQGLLNQHQPGYINNRDDNISNINSVYKKAMYREFTDDKFTTRKTRFIKERHLGILGPFIRGNVGDTIEIVLRNMASYKYNIILPNLVPVVDLSSPNVTVTYPGKQTVYRYRVPERAGPFPPDQNCIGSKYSSGTSPIRDTDAGLIGPLVICKRGVLDTRGERTDQISREFALAFWVIDENTSHYRLVNSKKRKPNRSDNGSLRLYSINGLIYNNLRGLVLDKGEKSAWYIFGIGLESGMHSIHFHGQLHERRSRPLVLRDIVSVFTGSHETVEMVGYNPGTWLLHCHMRSHTNNGMQAMYTVNSRSPYNTNGRFT